MTCAYVYPEGSDRHFLEFATETGDDVSVTELPLVEAIEHEIGAKPLDPKFGGEAAFELNSSQLEQISGFLLDMCHVRAVQSPDERDFLHGQDQTRYFDPFLWGK